MQTLFSLFLIAHGLIHAAIWLPSAATKAPFDPKYSWLLNGIGLPNNFVRAFAVILSIIAALALIGGGVGLLAHLGWWKTPILIGTVTSLFLLLLYFNLWFSLAILLNLAVLYLVAMRHWPVA